MEYLQAYRDILKAHLAAWELETDVKRGMPPPPSEKPCPVDATLIDLVPPQDLTIGRMPLFETIRRRKSRRQYTQDPLNLEELSFLLWATQGVRKTLRNGHSLRTVPSAGARHSFETYLSVHRVAGLEPGLCRYLPARHKLCLVRADAQMADKMGSVWGRHAGKSAVVFVWTTIPYRMEWQYPAVFAAKVIAMDCGHVIQNLYLASEAIGAGTYAAGTTDQEKMDALLGVDGEEEFVIYAAPVGKVDHGRAVTWTGEIGTITREGDVARLWVKSFSFWEGDVFVAEFPAGEVSDCREGDHVSIKGRIVDMCSSYDGWPLVRGSGIEKQEDAGAK